MCSHKSETEDQNGKKEEQQVTVTAEVGGHCDLVNFIWKKIGWQRSIAQYGDERPVGINGTMKCYDGWQSTMIGKRTKDRAPKLPEAPWRAGLARPTRLHKIPKAVGVHVECPL
jgi:hypothetical protein